MILHLKIALGFIGSFWLINAYYTGLLKQILMEILFFVFIAAFSVMSLIFFPAHIVRWFKSYRAKRKAQEVAKGFRGFFDEWQVYN